MEKWKKYSRAEKIEHLFDYPYEERGEKVRELWGVPASEYAESVYFPSGTPWSEIVTVLKITGKMQKVYAKVNIDDVYGVSVEDVEKNEDEALAMLGWRRRLMTLDEEDLFYIELCDENTLICNVCTESGFQSEHDYWANALLDLGGKVIRPFEPGHLNCNR